MAFKLLLCFLVAFSGSAVAALPPIQVKGSKFFFENGTQFFMKGVAYQQDAAGANAKNNASVKYVDPLADEKSCERDIPLLKELDTNTIRVYAIDPTADHSTCMKLLQDAGIYVISDLGEPSLSINRESPQWNTELFTRYQGVINELSQYPNVIGFFAGNEVSNRKNNTGASAYVKAAVRDTKRFIKESKSIKRWIGIGYAANDDTDIRNEISSYFNCDKTEDSIDFWGCNIYSWCGESNLERSDYAKHAAFFKNYSVPVFFAEYGCNDPNGAEGRIFQETPALYSEPMSSVFSGGIVYMYFEEENDFGLVEIKDGEANRMKNFKALKKQVAKSHPKGVNKDEYSSSNKMGECPVLSSNWRANKSLPPTPDKDLCDCMVKSRSCVPKKNISSEKYGDMFEYVCTKDKAACTGISGNTTTGVYGAYSMCGDRAKLAYVLDEYYKHQKSAAYACDFGGAAEIQSPDNDGSCRDALAKASSANKIAATATAPFSPASTERENDSGAGQSSYVTWELLLCQLVVVALWFGSGVAAG